MTVDVITSVGGQTALAGLERTAYKLLGSLAIGVMTFCAFYQISLIADMIQAGEEGVDVDCSIHGRGANK